MLCCLRGEAVRRCRLPDAASRGLRHGCRAAVHAEGRGKARGDLRLAHRVVNTVIIQGQC